MAPFVCCGFRRVSSPTPGPIHLVDNTQTRGRFPISTNPSTQTSASSGERATSARDVFVAATNDGGQGECLLGHVSTKPETRFGIQRKESMRKIRGVANRVRKSVSKDSAISKHSSKRDLRNSMSFDEIQQAPKTSMHAKVKSYLKDSKIDSGDYDEDAMPIKTPGSSWGRERIEGNPRRLSVALKGSSSTLPASHSERDRRDNSAQIFAPNSAASTLSRMLTVRGSSLNASRHDNEDKNKEKAEGPRPEKTLKNPKYIFRDGSRSPEKPSTRTPSPLGRSDTVIRTPSSTAVVELGKPTFLNTLGTQSTPDSPELLPQRMVSISDSVAGREWRLSFAPSYGPMDRLQFPGTIANEDITDGTEGAYGPSARVTPEAWACGASGLFQGSTFRKQPQSGFGQKDPASEHVKCGEFDDDGVKTANEELVNMPAPCGRKQSSGSDSVHLYNMRIPQRLASQGLLQSVSLPYLQEFATSGEDIATDEYNFANGKPRRRVSSSGIHSSKVPLAWGLPKKSAASSVYSYGSAYVTPSESQQSSMMFLNKMADRMNRLGPNAPAQDIISVSAVSNKHIDVTQLENNTGETSFHSSNESLTNRELAAAESRIMPRAKTWKEPKSSWFKEDFDEVAAVIANTNPQRRTVSETLKRKPRVSSYDGNNEHRLSIQPLSDRFDFVPGGRRDTGTSVWEKALREHEEEDEAIARTRLGSDAMLSSHHSFRRKYRHHIDPRKPRPHRHLIDRFSPEHKEQEFIQAKLGAYQLPSPSRKPTPPDDLNPVSTPNSFSSWERYPSFNRDQRSSASAGEADNVFPRDFAEEAASAARMARRVTGDVDPSATLPAARLFPREKEGRGRRKSKSMTFGRDAMAKLRKIYRVGSLEFASKTAFGSRGHRSSISEGRSVEYPELEMLPPRSPPLSIYGSGDIRLASEERLPSLRAVTTLNNAELAELSEFSAAKAAQRVGGTPGARTWSKMYVESCVIYPANSPPQASVLHDVAVGGSNGPEIGLEVAAPVEKDEDGGNVQHHQGSGSGSSANASDDVRKSTLDFKKTLEIAERMAREKALGLAV